MYRTFRLFASEEAAEVRRQLLGLEWQVGRTRVDEYVGSIKNNFELIPTVPNSPAQLLSEVVKDAVMNHADITRFVLPRLMTPPKFNRYQVGGEYQRHFDASPMGPLDMRTDYSCTVFLSDPDSYDGGQLHLETTGEQVVSVPRSEAGTCVVYESGGGHWVSPVTRGERISAVLWFRSLIQDHAKRDLVRRFREVMERCEGQKEPIVAGAEMFTTLSGIQTALSRMWFEA